MKCVATILLLSAIGCNSGPPDTESPVKTEKATVVQLAYTPEINGRTSGSTGLTSSGHVVFTGGSSVHTAEVWAVVFQCADHGKTFSLTGKDIYAGCRVGDVVTLEYVDIMHTGEDGKQSIVDHQTKRVILAQH